MDTIAHYLLEDIKLNQDYMYHQITGLGKYRSIVIGEFPQREKEKAEHFPFEYYYMGDIHDWPRFLSYKNIKAIHAHKGGHGAQILPVAMKYTVPLITSFRGQDGSAHHNFYHINRKRFKALMAQGSLFLPVCHYFKQEMLKLGFPKEKIKVLHGGIDIKQFPYRPQPLPDSNKKIRILSIGRLSKKKGFPILIHAFARVHRTYPHTELVIIGLGDRYQRGKLKKQAVKLNIRHAVKVRKQVEYARIVDEMKMADMFCLPCITTNSGSIEGIPNVLKEAMAGGIPVVSTRHAGIPELIEHGKSGLLAGEKDVKALADTICELIEHPKRRTLFSSAGREKVENDFNLEKQIKLQEKYYDRLLKGKVN